jgi:hypothetical protein
MCNILNANISFNQKSNIDFSIGKEFKVTLRDSTWLHGKKHYQTNQSLYFLFSKSYLFFFTHTKKVIYIFFLTETQSIHFIHNNRFNKTRNTIKKSATDQKMAALAKVWAAIFACRLMNFSSNFRLQLNNNLIELIIELNSDTPLCFAYIANTTWLNPLALIVTP